jgi:RNA polymerase sigma-70 factor (ECF subfamily)
MVKSESDAKEIIQEVFMKLWLKRESLTAIEIPGAWLHTLTSHAAYDFLRTQARYSLRLQKLPKVEDGADIVIDQLDARFTQAVINEAVEQLPFKRREVFRMARIEGKSRREIATELNISENTVRNQLVSAVESVREYLTQKGALYMPVLIFLLKDL